MKSNLTVIGW